ncbi:hypothetical protein IVG45_06645 [Methylomonas sp. LL1]|uniref:hypothetical protein n=1 Tax=Methylomonas sp. LL1 TaxID=2785785 RepID=UPI0018C429F8|nr:hypothetical protein [Methylomonas sp. LL1]QPK64628.1 hypothetical protein IVG45_06645 [Methylomonas sp. LL1]
MNHQNSELDAWLAGQDIFEQNLPVPEDWVAGFDANRQLVVFKLGPFKRLFLRPGKFNKRFYHQLYPLSIETWDYRRQLKLFDEFCTLDIALDIRFQATLAYVLKNSEMLESINQHIQALYADVIEDKINQELSNLADGSWVQKGLVNHEKRIAISVCEVLTQHHIQAEAVCRMSVSFVEFPDVQLGRDSVYLHVLKKTFELGEQKNQEMLRQQRLIEQQALLAKQQEREHLKQLAEMQRQIQLQEAEAQIQMLLDREQQIANQREVERRLHAEQVEHEQQLKQISLEIELRMAQQLEAKQRLAERQRITDQLAHQAILDDKRTLAEIQRRQAAELRWRQAEQSKAENSEGDDDEYPDTTPL